MLPKTCTLLTLCIVAAAGCDDKQAQKPSDKTAETKTAESKTAESKTAASKTAETQTAEAKAAPADGKAAADDKSKATDADARVAALPSDSAAAPDLPPMWAYPWSGKLAVDVTTMTDAEADALDAAIDKDGGNEGELKSLEDALVPKAFRGLAQVTVVDAAGASTAKVTGFGAQIGPGEVHLKIVLDRPAKAKANALVLARPPKNDKLKLGPPEVAVTSDAEMGKIIKATQTYFLDKLPDAKRALKKRPVTTEDIRPISGEFSPDHFAIYQVAWPSDFDDDNDEHQASAIVLLDGDNKIVAAPYPPTEYVRVDVIHVVDLDADGIDEIILDEHWMEGLYTKMLRWDPKKKAYEALTLTGDSA